MTMHLEQRTRRMRARTDVAQCCRTALSDHARAEVVESRLWLLLLRCATAAATCCRATCCCCWARRRRRRCRRRQPTAGAVAVAPPRREDVRRVVRQPAAEDRGADRLHRVDVQLELTTGPVVR